MVDGLIKTTKSICPECQQILDAQYVEEDGQAYMVKKCPDHGPFKDLVSINAKHFRWIQQFTFDSDAKILNPQVPHKIKGCPHDCGTCSFHVNSPAIAIIDVTYRCNLKCPVCYAAALSERGKNIEPSLEELRKIYAHFREDLAQPPVCAMFAGGEPTVRDDFPDIIRMTTEMGYIQRQVASNGIRFAKDIDFLQQCIDAGLNAIYLQFDGVDPEVYKKLRGANIWPLKQKVIENCRELNFPNVCLVPTISKFNLDQVPKIVDFAIDNLDVISVISFQPLSFCGRVEAKELLETRVTSSHVIDAINKYTNGETGWMYPMPTIAKFTKIASWISNQPEMLEVTCDSMCGFGSFVFVDPKTRKLRDITKLFNVPRFVRVTNKWYDRLLAKRQGKTRRFKNVLDFGILTRTIGELLDRSEDTLEKAQLIAELLTCMRNPFTDGVENFIKRAELFIRTMISSSREASADWLVKGNNLLLAMMHFQDGYNMDIERTRRCLVHYGYIDPKTQQVMAIPFCTMNTIHRPRIENELLMAQAITKDEAEVPIPKLEV
ncbi:MAG TPA: radical SAM protein [Candidatus Deferrimicrobium sp.]|nr:radical SAM protein [Candidatus Deferrimicrobium sp.]